MKNHPLFLFAGVVTCSLTLLTGAHAAGKQKTFAIIPKSISISFYNDVEKGCKEEGAKLGVNVIYTGPDTADAAKQVQVLQDLVSRGVDGFAVAPMDADSVFGGIESSIKKGIKVVTFDTLPEELKILKQNACNGLIGQRPYAMGVKSVDILNDLTEGKTVPAVVDTGVDVVTSSNVDQFLK